MNIQEATKIALSKKGCMARINAKWQDGLKIQPTNSCDNCYLIIAGSNIRGAMWNPSADDLMADDWKFCD